MRERPVIEIPCEWRPTLAGNIPQGELKQSLNVFWTICARQTWAGSFHARLNQRVPSTVAQYRRPVSYLRGAAAPCSSSAAETRRRGPPGVTKATKVSFCRLVGWEKLTDCVWRDSEQELLVCSPTQKTSVPTSSSACQSGSTACRTPSFLC